MNKKIIPINYTSRNYESIKNDLLEHARRYYSDVYKDFNQASFGSLMIDTVSYVGDILSFYLDYQVNESYVVNYSLSFSLHLHNCNHKTHDYPSHKQCDCNSNAFLGVLSPIKFIGFISNLSDWLAVILLPAIACSNPVSLINVGVSHMS